MNFIISIGLLLVINPICQVKQNYSDTKSKKEVKMETKNRDTIQVSVIGK